MTAYAKGLPLAYSSDDVQGGLFPRWDAPYTLTALVASVDSAWLDSGITEGFGLLWLWAFTVAPTKIVLSSTAAGPSAAEGAAIFFSTTAPGGMSTLLLTPERRFFRLQSANSYNIRWQAERIG